MINFGSPPVLSFDKTLNLLNVYIQKPDEDDSIIGRVAHHLKDVERAHICLSGGVDSQFWVRMCDHLGIPMRATTYLTYWNGSPINTDDFVCAQLTAKKYNVEWDVIDINLNELLGKPRLLELAKKYLTNSQQIAVHMHYLEQIVNTEETFFLGGDCVYLARNRPHRYTGWLQIMHSYYTFFEQHNARYVKDVYNMDPVLHYLFFEESIAVAKAHGIYMDMGADPNSRVFPSTHAFKRLVWESILPGEIPTLFKNTGFERLKKHLAMTTGVYNEFDIKYRHYLEQVVLKYMIDPTRIKTRTHGITLFDELEHEFNSTIDAYKCKPVTEYNFDF